MSNDKLTHGDSHRGLLKSTSIISSGTLSSRILGFIRDVILAKFLGTGFQADAFFVALKIPNLVRAFVGEGASDSAIVPVLAEYKIKSDKTEFWKLVNVVLILSLIILSVIVILGILLAPVIVRLIAPGFIADPAKLRLTIQATRIIFPYLILIGLASYGTSILYTFRSFAVPAYSPCLFNIAVIAGALISPRVLKEPVYGLAFSVIAGGLLQLLFYLGPLGRQGLKLERPKNLRHPGAVKIGKLLVPRMVGAGVYELSVFIDTFCASLGSIVGAGGISAIYYANRIIQFPMGIFGLAMASAVLPTLSGLAAHADIDQFKKTLIFSLENIFFIMVPTAVMIILLSQPVIKLLFERGQFDAYSTRITSSALLFYALGLFSFGGVKILVSAFHSLQDTRTPVKIALLCLGINAALNFILMFPMKIGGIALASSIAAAVDFVLLLYFMRRRLGGFSSGFPKFLLKILMAGIITAVVVWLAWAHAPIYFEILKLAVVGVVGYAVYGLACLVLKVQQAQKIWRWIKKSQAIVHSP